MPLADDEETRTMPRASGSAAPLALGSRTGAASAHSGNLAAALDHDDAGRMKVFSLVVIVIAVSAAVAILLLGGHPTVQRLHLAGVLLAGVGATITFVLLHGGATYTVRMNTVFGLTAVIAVSTGYFYWGIYSAVLLLLPFGAFIFSSNKSLASALIVTGFGYGAHLVAALLVVFEVIRDYSLIQPRDLTRAEQLGILAVIHIIFIGALIAARGARSSTEKAVREMERAVRALSLREQLLAEAREELVQALQIGGPGRYTDQELGNFQLGALLGRGAMGEVYEARRKSDDAEAAVKVLHADVLANPHHLRRFLRELELIQSIDSANVVKVLETASLGQGLPYLAMERLRGHTLAEHLQLHGVLDVATVAELVREVGRGLEAAHAAGVIHRDVKPQNLFLTDDGSWKVLDFGVGTLIDSKANLTGGRLVGTPAYMSPEQVRGKQVDYRSDLYALAAVAYRALTGRSVASGREPVAVVHAVAYDKPKRPSSLRAMNRDVDFVMAIGLAKSPDDRFESADRMADSLAAAGEGRLPRAIALRAHSLATFI